jgi:hypothetical protein
MIINVNFNIEAWVKQLTIEASSENDAIEKLMHMSLAEMIEEGAIIDSAIKISDADTSIVEYDLVVQASEIEYDLDPEIMDISVIEYLKAFLPKEQTLTLRGVTDSDDVEELIKDELLDDTNYNVKALKFQVIEKK